MGVRFSIHAERAMRRRRIASSQVEHVLTNRETSYISEDSDTALVVLGTAPGLLYPQRLKVVVRVDDEEWVITVANRDDEE